MSDPVLVPCLVALRTEFNQRYPGRDKGADGWIGDPAHQQESSDHNPDESGRTPYEDADSVNEVHALDIDKDLKAAGGAAALNADVERIRLAHQTGRDNRLQNIIWQGRIASRSWGWDWHNYTGASAHFDHAHFSARYVTATEADTSTWGVFQEDHVDQADIDKIINGVVARMGSVLGLGKMGDRTVGGTLNALVTETVPGAAVPNIINREVAPLLQASENRIIAAVEAPGQTG
jgi:hypothetical protein